MSKPVTVLLTLCLLSPGPAAAQAVERTAGGAPAPATTVPACPPGEGSPASAPLPVQELGLPLSPALAGPADTPRPPAEASSLALGPQAVPAAAPARPAIVSLQAAGREGTAAQKTKRGFLKTAAEALAGFVKAGLARPGLFRLGAPLPPPRADVGSEAQRAAAETFFNRKAALAAAVGDEGGNLLDIEPWTILPEWAGKKPGRGEKAGGGKSAEKDEKHEHKYPARDIRFNEAILPSVAMAPDRAIEPLLVQAIDAAKESIHIAMYEFKLREVLKALRRAKARGVQIRIVMDYSNTFPRPWRGSSYVPHRSLELQALINEGFDIQIVRGLWAYGIQHNKFMVFDGKLAEFGSYNYTWTSELHHFENAKFTDDSRLIAAFLESWKYMRALSLPFDQARNHDWPKELPKPPADPKPSVEPGGVELPLWFFSPNGGGEDWIVKNIEAAKETLDITMFTFRSTRIAEAMAAAHRRGVKVRVILDKSQSEQEGGLVYGEWLAFHGVKVKILAGPDPEGPAWAQKNHNKFMVTDGRLVEMGSFNWTKNAALMSFENGHFSADPVDAKAYSMFYEDMYRRGQALDAPAAEPRLPGDEELVQELLKEPEPIPAPEWPEIPAVHGVTFNGEEFPSFAVKPQHPLKDLLVQAINVSRETIDIALYEFTLPEVMDALREAKKRGVRIRLVVDFSHIYPKGMDHARQERQMSAQYRALIEEGFDIRVLRGVTSTGTLHNKFAIFDGGMLELGSYNWSKTAEENHFENMLFTAEKERIAFYRRYWDWMRGLSQPVEGAGEYPWTKHKPGPAPVDDDLAVELNGRRFPRSAASPNGGVEALVIKAVEAAKLTIDVAMFSFYSQPIAEALLRAKERGVAVRIALDENQSKLMKLDEWFAYHGFDVRITAGPDHQGNVMFEKMHNKLMIVDGKLFETGSFNYTPNADLHNFDNANFFNDLDIIAAAAVFFVMLYERGYAPRKPKTLALSAENAEEFFQALTSIAGPGEGE